MAHTEKRRKTTHLALCYATFFFSRLSPYPVQALLHGQSWLHEGRYPKLPLENVQIPSDRSFRTDSGLYSRVAESQILIPALGWKPLSAATVQMLLETKAPGASSTVSPRVKPNRDGTALVLHFVLGLFPSTCNKMQQQSQRGQNPRQGSPLGMEAFLLPSEVHWTSHQILKHSLPPLASPGPNFSLLAPCMKLSMVVSSRGARRTCLLLSCLLELALSTMPWGDAGHGVQDVGCRMGDVGCRMKDVWCRRRLLEEGRRLRASGSGFQTGAACGGAAGWGVRRRCSQGRGRQGLLPAVPYLLMASRGGSCPSDEVQCWAQPGAGFKQRRKVGGEKKLVCGAGFTKQSPCCSSTAILWVLSQEGIKSLDSVHSRSTETRDEAGGIRGEQF